MTLENLLGIALESVEADAAGISRLLEAARRSLADAQLDGISPEGRFDMAYKSIMQAANAALQANGYRTLTSKPGHHQVMIQSLPRTIGLETSTMVILDGLRKQRNGADYSGEPIGAVVAKESIQLAEQLLERVERWLKANRPQLLLPRRMG